jgi:hypothetical protein
MQNDSIETLLVRHYGSTAPAPVELEKRLSAMVRRETAAVQAQQQAVKSWEQRRVSRRRVLQMVTFSGVGLSAIAVGLNTIQAPRRSAYSL